MARSIQAQPPLSFVPPALNLSLVRLTQLLLPAWLRFKTPLERIETENVEQLAELYRDFEAGKVRFLLAFRHPSTYDPLCMGYLLSQAVPALARKRGIVLKNPVHAYFLYDRGVPLWAGAGVGWLLPRLGGTSIQRGKLDRQALKTARELLVQGVLPMMAAPEGATNGHNEIVSPLEPGVAQLGFWCAEDLAAARRTEQVFIVPVGIRYRYSQPPWEALDRLLGRLEVDLGLTADPRSERYDRLLRIGESLLARMEDFYTRFYHRTLAPNANLGFGERLPQLLEVALQVAEEFFTLPAKGSFIDRCRRIEQAGWERIYREDLKDPASLSPVERGLADRVAEETDLRMWHMRLVENFVAVSGNYVRTSPSADRFAETALIALRTVERLKGEGVFVTTDLGPQHVHIVVGTPLSVSERFAGYRESRQGAKQAVVRLTADLQAALETML